MPPPALAQVGDGDGCLYSVIEMDVDDATFGALCLCASFVMRALPRNFGRGGEGVTRCFVTYPRGSWELEIMDDFLQVAKVMKV